MPISRHFTATGFVVENGRVLLHWHAKVKAWLPPGGHIDHNEDPVQAVLREVEEETGLRTSVVSTGTHLDLQYPVQVSPPFTIMVEDIHDSQAGYHQHIDMIYFCRLESSSMYLKDGWVWVTSEDLRKGTPLILEGSPVEPPPEDVRLLAVKAIEIVSGSRA